MTIKCELTMLTFTKTKNTRLPDCVHNAGVTLQSRDIPHSLPSPIFYERAPAVIVVTRAISNIRTFVYSNIPTFVFSLAALTYKQFCASRHINVTLNPSATECAQSVSGTCLLIYLFIYLFI
jgi:hypothetical protein